MADRRLVTNPPLSLLVKLGSIARHVQELLSPDGADPVDAAAIEALLDDPEVVEWMECADELALLPVLRGGSV